MERGNENEGKREKVNSSVSSYVLRKDMFNLLDFIERLKHEEDQIALDMDRIEKLKLELTFMSTFPLLSYSKLDGFNAKMSRKAEHIFCLVQSVFYPSGDNMLFKYDMDHVVHRLLENLDRYISSLNCSKSSATMTEEKLVEHLDLLLKLDAPLSTYLESSPDILREYLIHLQAHMVTVLTASTSTRNIHVMVEFLLIVLTDVPKDIIHHEKLYVLLARVGALTREVLVETGCLLAMFLGIDKHNIYPPAPPLTRYKEVAFSSAKKKLVESVVLDNAVNKKLDALTTSKLCVRMNTLQIWADIKGGGDVKDMEICDLEEYDTQDLC
ncbi:hypothetical protein K7X08_030542 [Anisodus acutangulus]|uniref:Uncharacterized protein n=1 Tax=Anisodus acutangulus TaxID=402998 RepID=A0A9Q1MUC6_9SOLA|nr:hypothetical protein K7X08_030542 [Anisodus acutangulus]